MSLPRLKYFDYFDTAAARRAFTENRVNSYAIQHDRTSRDVGMSDTEVEIELEMRGPDHIATFLEEMDAAGYDVDVLH